MIILGHGLFERLVHISSSCCLMVYFSFLHYMLEVQMNTINSRLATKYLDYLREWLQRRIFIVIFWFSQSYSMILLLLGSYSTSSLCQSAYVRLSKHYISYKTYPAVSLPIYLDERKHIRRLSTVSSFLVECRVSPHVVQPLPDVTYPFAAFFHSSRGLLSLDQCICQAPPTSHPHLEYLNSTAEVQSFNPSICNVVQGIMNCRRLSKERAVHLLCSFCRDLMSCHSVLFTIY